MGRGRGKSFAFVLIISVHERGSKSVADLKSEGFHDEGWREASRKWILVGKLAKNVPECWYFPLWIESAAVYVSVSVNVRRKRRRMYFQAEAGGSGI